MVASKLLLGEESRKLSVILVNKMVGQERLIIFGQQPFVPLLLGHLFFSCTYIHHPANWDDRHLLESTMTTGF
jgi:hypothetical protein